MFYRAVAFFLVVCLVLFPFSTNRRSSDASAFSPSVSLSALEGGLFPLLPELPSLGTVALVVGGGVAILWGGKKLWDWWNQKTRSEISSGKSVPALPAGVVLHSELFSSDQEASDFLSSFLSRFSGQKKYFPLYDVPSQYHPPFDTCTCFADSSCHCPYGLSTFPPGLSIFSVFSSAGAPVMVFISCYSVPSRGGYVCSAKSYEIVGSGAKVYDDVAVFPNDADSFSDFLPLPQGKVVSSDAIPSDATIVDVSSASSASDAVPLSDVYPYPLSTSSSDVVSGDASSSSVSNSTSVISPSDVAKAIDSEISQSVQSVSVPALPSVPQFDTSIDAPTPPSFLEKLKSLLPYLDISSRVRTSFSGYCSFSSSFSLFGQDVPIHIDFCRYSSYIQKMGDILVMISGFLAVLVIFGL